MRQGIACILVALACAIASEAHAQKLSFFNGEELHEALADTLREIPRNQFFSAIGVGYVFGVHDAMNGVPASWNATLCFRSPASVSRGQVIAIVRRFLEERPEERSNSAESLVVGALARVWPCK